MLLHESLQLSKRLGIVLLPKWVGPSRAQVGGPTPGPSGWAQAGSKWAQAGPKPEIWDPKKSKKYKFSKSKSVLPKMSARSGLVGKNPPRPIWAPLGPFFAWAGKIEKMRKFCLFSLVGPWALFTRFGALAAIHPRWGNRYFHMCSHIVSKSLHICLPCLCDFVHSYHVIA